MSDDDEAFDEWWKSADVAARLHGMFGNRVAAAEAWARRSEEVARMHRIVDVHVECVSDAEAARDAALARVEELEADVEKWRSRNDEPDFTDDDREWLASRPGKEALIAELQSGLRSNGEFIDRLGTDLAAALERVNELEAT